MDELNIPCLDVISAGVAMTTRQAVKGDDVQPCHFFTFLNTNMNAEDIMAEEHAMLAGFISEPQQEKIFIQWQYNNRLLGWFVTTKCDTSPLNVTTGVCWSEIEKSPQRLRNGACVTHMPAELMGKLSFPMTKLVPHDP